MKVIIVGGGIGGLTTALMLHARGIDCEIYEQSDGIRELGVGMHNLPHTIKEMGGHAPRATLPPNKKEKSTGACGLSRGGWVGGVPRPYELFFTNRFGQEIWRELR